MTVRFIKDDIHQPFTIQNVDYSLVDFKGRVQQTTLHQRG